ncbi:MAG: phospholipase D-like domain-containing protein [Chlamydiales bacterium]
MTANPLYVTAYACGATVLLAMNLDQNEMANLAGFAILCCPPNKPTFYLANRINLNSGIKDSTTQWVPSNLAPFQKFRWVHCLQIRKIAGLYTYVVTAMYFVTGSEKLEAKFSASVKINLTSKYKEGKIGFTRGYISSQAYVDKFNNKPIKPQKKTLDFDTSSYQDQYEWLGGNARKLLFSFLEEAIEDPSISVDLFAYDLDEPDFIKNLQKLKGRLRAILDDAPLHKKKGALEIEAAERLKFSAGKKNVVQGHFKRFCHNKILIQKKNGKPIKVLTGSANFSIRGLYIQANNILIFDKLDISRQYEEAFEIAFTKMKKFQTFPIASRWFDFTLEDLVPVSISFSPHISHNVSLELLQKSIKEAKSSVLFSLMSMNGKGPVIESLENLINRTDIYSYGIVQASNGLDLFKPGVKTGKFTPFSYLKDSIPKNFKQEWSGGTGQSIHHKFIVIDFNGENPIVFTGSSNFTSGGEEQNGDNLIAIYNREAAAMYAVEAIRLTDHYHFRYRMKLITTKNPLVLKRSDEWAKPYYDKNNPKFKDRELFTVDSAKRDQNIPIIQFSE